MNVEERFQGVKKEDEEKKAVKVVMSERKGD